MSVAPGTLRAKAGDLVRVGAGAGEFLAEVRKTSRDGARRGRLEVRGVAGARLDREVLIREVTAHWRRVA